MFTKRSVAIAVLIAGAAGAAQAGGVLSFNSGLEWNGVSTTGSDGFAEDAEFDTDVFQSTSSGTFTVTDSNTLAGAWAFNLGVASTLSALIFDAGPGSFTGANPASITVTINGISVNAARNGGGPASYAVDFGSNVFSAGPHTMNISGFTTGFDTDYGPDNQVDITLVATSIPEPETYAMLIAGLGAVGFMARRRQSQSQPQ